jgi:hypothetical protein
MARTKAGGRGGGGGGASDRVRREWLRRVEEEYRSAAITQHVGLWLTQLGMSPDLLRAALRIADDELTHADLSHEAYVRAGGSQAPSLPRETLGLRASPGELEHQVTRGALRVFCLGETVAVPLFKVMREGARVPVAKRALDRILRDEVRHRDFGWALLDELFALPMADALRSLVVRELPAYLAAVRSAYGGGATSVTEISAADRSWGLISPSEYAAAVERTLVRDWIPRFAKRGVDARAAWGSG